MEDVGRLSALRVHQRGLCVGVRAESGERGGCSVFFKLMVHVTELEA